ncbi:MAG: 4Fe-4S dicluster domain-containing protein [Bacteroidales bacterium]|jgi:NADH-quinone oxidoreductase subunit I|nr:4Fe-4S dicluster domain-containing protein [Bacteroidales bacterium]
MKIFRYFKDIFLGIYHLLQGMYIAFLNMVRSKITEKYPENRLKKVKMERFRGLLTMPHNAQNEHKCTACGICGINCPNGTIQVISKKVTDETGKEKRVLDRYLYDIGSCTFCALCTISCPQGAIDWSPEFEHTVFTRSKLVKQLNREGSSLEVKPKINNI